MENDKPDAEEHITKEQFQRLKDKIKELSKSGTNGTSVPARPPNRSPGVTSARTPPFKLSDAKKTATLPGGNSFKPPAVPPPGSKRGPSSCKYPGCSGTGCDHRYEEVELKEENGHQYETLQMEENDTQGTDVPSRLKAIQKSQDDILQSIESLHNLVLESNSTLQDSLSNLQFKVMETSDHLGQQILHVRRDLVTFTK